MCVKSFRPCPAMAKENSQDVNQGQVEAGKVTRSPVKDLAEVWVAGTLQMGLMQGTSQGLNQCKRKGGFIPRAEAGERPCFVTC